MQPAFLVLKETLFTFKFVKICLNTKNRNFISWKLGLAHVLVILREAHCSSPFIGVKMDIGELLPQREPKEIIDGTISQVPCT